MSFLKKLTQIKKTKDTNATTVKSSTAARSSNFDSVSKTALNEMALDPLNMQSSLLPKKYIREEDPAVKRLKELRRKERAARGLDASVKKVKRSSSSTRAKSSLSMRTKKNGHNSNDNNILSESKFKKTLLERTANQNKSSLKPYKTIEKKLTFEELMKQAENVKNDKKGPTTSNSTNAEVPTNRFKSKKVAFKGFKPRTKTPTSSTNNRKIIKEPVVSKTHVPRRQKDSEKLVKVSLPKNSIARPSDKLKSKLESKQRGKRSKNRGYYSEEEDDDLDDFIEDDDPGYDRNEIWAMFNRNGRPGSSFGKEQYYDDDDDDDDDMEADGLDILEEEELSAKAARLEDKREEKWLKRHEQEKRQKLLDYRK
ncbi:uncharacterized protein SCODWIG_01568 [Saccharomycodes ludwigii]|uniref:Protein SPT2 n=1 Tax=Saccharomycodes ludwigii TaxID=36035 RepID=A0A376B539_9ASCO|nr:uncharacterized protein SCODWIG_01568 [Saccharomycodes ludwigii]